MVSVIIPVFNESKVIADCLNSLKNQNYTDFELIIIDDGSTDDSKTKIKSFKPHSKNRLTILVQEHKGPATARNYGASTAKGDIFVFVDADMTFDRDFIKNLIWPIQNKDSKGTFTKEEYVSNWDNPIARAWNYNQGPKGKERVPQNDPYQGSVFRAILASEFAKSGGFDDIGYTDDWSLSRKLGYKATLAPDAVCYHHNPDTFADVYNQARWMGKNEFISGNMIRKIYYLFYYSPLIQLPRSLYLALKYAQILIIPVIALYSLGIQISIVKSIFGENKYK